MSYFLFKYDGTVLAQINEGDINTDTSLSLPGAAVTIRGELTNENLVQRLENFAKDTAPTSPLRGQMWYDTSRDAMASFDGIGWNYAFNELAIASPINFTGDLTGSLVIDGVEDSVATINFANTATAAGNYTKFTVDAKGVITSASQINSQDVITALGYTPLPQSAIPQQSLPTLPTHGVMLWRVDEDPPTGFVICDGTVVQTDQGNYQLPVLTPPDPSLVFVIQLATQ